MKLTDEHDRPIPFVNLGMTLDQMEDLHKTLGWSIEGLREIENQPPDSVGWLTLANDDLVDPNTNWWQEE